MARGEIVFSFASSILFCFDRAHRPGPASHVTSSLDLCLVPSSSFLVGESESLELVNGEYIE